MGSRSRKRARTGPPPARAGGSRHVPAPPTQPPAPAPTDAAPQAPAPPAKPLAPAPTDAAPQAPAPPAKPLAPAPTDAAPQAPAPPAKPLAPAPTDAAPQAPAPPAKPLAPAPTEAARQAPAPPAEPLAPAPGTATDDAWPEPDAPPNRYARGRARDEAIRQGLEPLAPGERPRPVTIAAIVAFVFAIANVVATLTVDDLSSGQNDPTLFAVVWTAVLVVAGAGMLARRYWAVLGFQCVLGLQIVVFSLAVTRVQKWWLAVAMTIAIGLMGWLFWKLVRPMARLQMPDRPDSARS